MAKHCPISASDTALGIKCDSESGLDYFGARYYGSNMGRWLSPDWSASPEPVTYAQLVNPQTLNLYQYVKNNPTTLSDFDGHIATSPERDVVGSAKRVGDGTEPGVVFGVNAITTATDAFLAAMQNQQGLDPAEAALGQSLKSVDATAMAAEKAALGLTRDSVANGDPHEYGGLILQRTKDGRLIYTKAVQGQERSVDIDKIHVPKGYSVVGEYHTHPHRTSAEGQGPSTGDVYRLRTPERASRMGYVTDSYSGAVYRYTQYAPVKGPYDTGVYGTKIGTIP